MIGERVSYTQVTVNTRKEKHNIDIWSIVLILHTLSRQPRHDLVHDGLEQLRGRSLLVLFKQPE
jgi:hypothetical protein